jgi:hypothetical protein
LGLSITKAAPQQGNKKEVFKEFHLHED